MQDCVFCRIAKGDIPAEVVHETDTVLVFKEIRPAAPVHLLLIPKKHIPAFFDLSPGDAGVMGDLQLAAAEAARKSGLDKGFRLVSNCGEDAGQEVSHIHFHLMGGRTLGWPPG